MRDVKICIKSVEKSNQIIGVIRWRKEKSKKEKEKGMEKVGKKSHLKKEKMGHNKEKKNHANKKKWNC